METCEICGKKTDKIYLAQIEEANMWVCTSCSKGKKIMKSVDLKEVEKPSAFSSKKNQDDEEIVEHFGEQVKKARETLGLPLKVLAERIAEKESTLIRLEKEKALPTDTLRKKLEKELGIKLSAKTQGNDFSGGYGNKGPITLGDAAFKKGQKTQEEEE
ncbi:MAG: helix-turn-helix domain-containing protein [Candidatus Micrarchaeales archaeon]